MAFKEKIVYALNVGLNKYWFKQSYNSNCQSILVVKWDEIGDMATSTHVFEILKSQYPNAKITVLCKPFVRSLIEYDPYIDEIYTDIEQFDKRFDLVLELRGDFKTLLKAIWYRVPYRSGRAEVRFANRGAQLHEIKTNYFAIEPVLNSISNQVQPKLYFSAQNENQVNEFLRLNSIEKYALIHAGARRVLRQWEPAKFAQICKYLKEQYKLEIICAGTLEDEKTIQQIQAQLDFKIHLFTKGFSLSDFSYLCSKASVYVGNESGPLHIASAFKVPLVALYGPGVPNVFYPISPKAKVLHHVLDCNPCDQIHCVQPDNPCISRILVVDVMKSLNEILEG